MYVILFGISCIAVSSIIFSLVQVKHVHDHLNAGEKELPHKVVPGLVLLWIHAFTVCILIGFTFTSIGILLLVGIFSPTVVSIKQFTAVYRSFKTIDSGIRSRQLGVGYVMLCVFLACWCVLSVFSIFPPMLA